MSFKNGIILILFAFFLKPTLCQFFERDNFGIKLGLEFDFGLHSNRLGIGMSSFYQYDLVQTNISYSFRFNFNNLGGRSSFLTHKISTGVGGVFGNRNAIENFNIQEYYFHGDRNYGLSYHYIWYLDNVNSSQRSGGFHSRIQNFNFIIENDFFAGLGQDQLRTGSMSLIYRQELVHYFTQLHLWTGKTLETPRKKDKTNLYPNGYKDLSNNEFGKTSHGILSIGSNFLLPFQNVATASIGIDAEQIRNFFQNKLIHDKNFTPERWRKPNAHYPMLNEEGYPVSSKSEIRSALFYLQIGLNKGGGY